MKRTEGIYNRYGIQCCVNFDEQWRNIVERCRQKGVSMHSYLRKLGIPQNLSETPDITSHVCSVQVHGQLFAHGKEY